MFKKLLNQATIDLTVNVEGPILIKSGIEGGEDPSLPDMQFVRTYHREKGETVYLPGSSLKGVIRSYCEKIARTVGATCCNIFDDSKYCGKKIENENKRRKRNSEPQLMSSDIYKDYSCRICKIFGSTGLASRIKFNDAYPAGGFKTDTRTGVAIDRILGSVAHGPFETEVVTEGDFTTQITFRNFELWQLGLLGLALRDLRDGRIRIGFAKSRGLGEVKATLNYIEIEYFGMDFDKKNQNLIRIADKSRFPCLKNGKTIVYGVGKLCIGEDNYGFNTGDEVAVDAKLTSKGEIMRVHIKFDNENIDKLLKPCVEEHWREVIKNDDNR
jgi:CRISPR-associated RAMP protein (TIGR02581 family)